MHLFFHKDFFIDITSVDSRTKVLERETIGRVERIVDKWESDGAKLFPFEQIGTGSEFGIFMREGFTRVILAVLFACFFNAWTK